MKLLTILFVLFFSVLTFSQSIGVNADLTSRYVWRGLELSQAPNLQPNLYLQVGTFRIGSFGSFALSNQENSWDEVDLYALYTINSNFGDFTLGVTDYYFPGRGVPWSEWNNDSTGAHLVEAGLLYQYLFFDISGNINVFGDDSYTIYSEIGASIEAKDMGSLRLFAGFTPGTEYDVIYSYNTETFAFTNFGVKATKYLSGDKYPASIAYIFNPINDVAYLVFTLGI